MQFIQLARRAKKGLCSTYLFAFSEPEINRSKVGNNKGKDYLLLPTLTDWS